MQLSLLCWNGPCEGRLITDCPLDVQPGYAVAIPWQTVQQEDRFAIYVLLEKPGSGMGLVYENRSYEKPYQAQQRVHQITAQVRMIQGRGSVN